MAEPDWDDPAVEEDWCLSCRETVSDYLAQEGLQHGAVAEWPAWHVAPYVSIWAVESLLVKGQVGWWAICGDLPTDYISSSSAKHPRQVLGVFADTWSDVAEHLKAGRSHPEIQIGPPERGLEFASLLEGRSRALRRFADEDSIWGEGEVGEF